jgi:hypothetical protein
MAITQGVCPPPPAQEDHAPLGHAGTMQNILFCMVPFMACKLFRYSLGFWRATVDEDGQYCFAVVL